MSDPDPPPIVQLQPVLDLQVYPTGHMRVRSQSPIDKSPLIIYRSAEGAPVAVLGVQDRDWTIKVLADAIVAVGIHFDQAAQTQNTILAPPPGMRLPKAPWSNGA